MAKVLQNIFTAGEDQIAQNYVIESWHVSQSVDAFTGAEAYDITLSGSLELTGSFSVNGLPEATGAGYNTVVVNSTTGQFSYSTSGGSGASGTAGTSGANGSSGTSGANGSSGTSGTRGSSGTSGTSGASGASIIWLGDWNISTPYQVNDVVYYNGSSYIAILPNTGVTPGTSPAEWELIALAGTNGSSGGSGSSGTSGTRGSSGSSGANGSSGTSGVGGVTTAGTNVTVTGTGTIADPYVVNANASASGSSGSSGASGSSGTSGANGTSGTSGANGTSGTSGATGSSGTSGANGTSGTSGANGSSGTSGAAGSSGTSGTRGSSGSSGTSGTSGLSFIWESTWNVGTNYQVNDVVFYNRSSYIAIVDNSGAQPDVSPAEWELVAQGGNNGTSGTSGATGSSGTSGANGSSGTSGANGSSGTSGANGSSGTSGTPGSSGTSGANGTGFGTITLVSNAPSTFGFEVAEVPSNNGYTAAGWIRVTIGGTPYYVPAWTL